MEGKFLGLSVVALSRCIDASTSPKYCAALKVIANRRHQWFSREISRVEEQVSWDISDTDFHVVAAVTQFLRGESTLLVIRGYRGMDGAFDRAEMLRDYITAPVEIISAGRGQHACVQIVTTSQEKSCPNTNRNSKWLDCLLLVNEDLDAERENIAKPNNEIAIPCNYKATGIKTLAEESNKNKRNVRKEVSAVILELGFSTKRLNNRSTYAGLTGIERETERLGLLRPVLATNLGGQFSQLYDTPGAPAAPIAAEDISSADAWPFHSIGAPNDVLVPNGEAYQRISELLSRVTHQAGEYSFGGEAKTLPAMPGVALKGDEEFISLPLQKENCDKLLKESTGQGEKLWALPGDQVEVRNPEWGAGLEKLSELSAARMGYKGVVMEIVLSKLMVIGQGGSLPLQQDPDENDRCVAKLVVQLPSRCSGGNVVVNEEGTKNQYRYTLGENKATAAFKPHYVLYTAGAFRTVKEVTSEFSLMLVYSLCLPAELPFIRGSNGSDLLRMELADEIMKLDGSHGSRAVKGENVNFQNVVGGNVDDATSRIALVLSKSFQLQDITIVGSDTQASMGLDRFAYLRAANAILPPEKQSRFYIARLQYEIPDYYGRWDQKKAVERATWHTIRGKETLCQLWKNGDGEFVYRYERYAIVGGPTCVDIENTHTFMGETAAADSVFTDTPVDFDRLWMLLKYETDQYKQGMVGIPPHPAAVAALNSSYENGDAALSGQEFGSQSSFQSVPAASKSPVSLACCHNLCQAISESEDVLLVDVFFRKYFSRLGQKRELVPSLADIVRKFGWDCVSASFVRALDGLSYSVSMSLALQLANALIDVSSGNAALTIIAVEKAGFAFATCPEELVTSSDVSLLWKHAMACSSPQAFRDVADMFARLEAKIIGPVYGIKTSAMADGSNCRNGEAFAWEIVDMNFVGSSGMVTFLQGPNTLYQVRCFKGLDDAHKRMALLLEKIKAPIKMTVGGRGRDAYVLVTKQAGKFTQKMQDIHRFKAEIHQLNHCLSVDTSPADSAVNSSMASGAPRAARALNTAREVMPIAVSNANSATTDPPNTIGTKRPREEPEVIVIE
ncbi:hypothetical protein PHYPSEUDO_009531 [Phytophthora pseudosyringae]|uniref:Uncharacterized protein n=1 Tax=Phytophthora pseudosyringae TaxID=221518 RepID=A0A8T1VBQ1_9STRA|nr:hypothetical protein PHYPSEUDO_009531 [Phytophthora pseudosyringae]